MNKSVKAIWTGVASATVLSLAGFVGSVQADIGIPGSACKATGTAQAKLNVGDSGAVYNKNTAGSLKVTCPLAAMTYSTSDVYLNYVKRNSQSMSCTLHMRSWDGQSGSSTTQSTTYNGSNFFYFGYYFFDYFNSVTCTLPAATGSTTASQNGIFGAYVYQF